MKTPLLETISKAAQAASLLESDIREAHKQAIRDNPLLELMLRDVISDSVKVQCKLAQIAACLDSK